MALRDKVAVTGVGETRYQRGAARGATALQIEASLAAIADAGLKPRDIDGIIPMSIAGGPAEEVATNLGITDFRFSATTPLGGMREVMSLSCTRAKRGCSSAGARAFQRPIVVRTAAAAGAVADTSASRADAVFSCTDK